MKKRVLTMILAGIMIMSMTACGNKDIEVATTETVVETTETTEESSIEGTKENKPVNTAEAVDATQSTITAATTANPAATPKTATPKTTTASNSTGKTGSTASVSNTTTANTKTEATAKPGSTAKPTSTAKPKATTKPAETAKPTVTPQPTAKPAATATPQPACAHEHKKYETAVEANCQHGYDNIYCTDCGAFLGTNYQPQGSHGSTTRHTTTEPTCTSGGWWEETCDLCGAVINSGSIDSLGCVDNGDGWCSRCGAELRDHSQPDVPSVDDVLKDLYGDTPTPAPNKESEANGSDTSTTSEENSVDTSDNTIE